MEEERRRSRLSQYLDFVKLYTDLYKNKEAKKEANVIWKEKIQRENYEEMSSVDYLEQLAILKSKKYSKQEKISGSSGK